MHLGQEYLVVRVEIAIFGCNNKDVEQGKSRDGVSALCLLKSP